MKADQAASVSLTVHSAFSTPHSNMALNYAKIFNRRVTPQSQPIPGSNQVRNSGSGYSWAVDDWTRLDRFLFHFVEYAMRGWGRGLRNAVGHWYTDPGADDLAHQAVKYQQRDGWSHSDLLRLAHPKAPSPQHDAVFRWMLAGADALGEREVKRKVRGEDRIAKYGATGALPKFIEAFERVKRSTNVIE